MLIAVRSSPMQSYAERAEQQRDRSRDLLFTFAEARCKILAAQAPFLDRLDRALSTDLRR
jgi:predicted NUDIX family NTP pyrophosphohydrolase